MYASEPGKALLQTTKYTKPKQYRRQKAKDNNRRPVTRGRVASCRSVPRDLVPGAARQPCELHQTSPSWLGLRRASARSPGLQDQSETHMANQRRRFEV